ncbi:MAG: helix-turn-helix domain-containing protein [Lachnospiraceae bacterium]
MTTGERIKQRRLELKMSVDELAKKLNKNRATVYRYESDEIENFPTSILIPLAKALETTPTYLMGWDPVSDEEIGDVFYNDMNEDNSQTIFLGTELNRTFEKLAKEYGKSKGVLTSMFFSYDLSRLPENQRILNEKNIRFVIETIINENKESTTIAAHFDGDEYTEEELDEIRQFAEFVKNKRKS